MSLPRVYAFDTETFLIEPGLLAPPLVCGSFAWRTSRGEIDHVLHDRAGALDTLRTFLLSEPAVLVGHNTAYDLAVVCAEEPRLIPLVFHAYDKGRIRCTQTREKLLDIARGVKGTYALNDLAGKYIGKVLDKGADGWRTRYRELVDVPLEKWPERARAYAETDAVTTLEVYDAQTAAAGLKDGEDIPDEIPQTFAAWVLHLMSVWGMRTNAAAVAALKASLETRVAASRERLIAAGLMRYEGPKKDPRRKVVKNTQVIRDRVAAAYAGRNAPEPTETGLVPTDYLTLKESHDPDLVELADAQEAEKLLGSFVPVIEAGTRVPINPRYNVLVDTGRTSCREPNLQQLPKDGGVRECFEPRPGFGYVFVDLKTAELRTWAEACYELLGYSDMGEALKAKRDLHVVLAADLLGVTYEAAIARWNDGEPLDSEINETRDLAKVGNFGLPAGMAAATLCDYALGNYGLRLTLETAERVKAAWLRRWKEAKPYQKFIGDLVGHVGDGRVRQLVSGRVRGGLGFCDGCNTYFQGLAADWAKAWLIETSRESYVYRPEALALYGSRPVALVHDEIGIEAPLGRIGAAAARLRELAIITGRRYLKRVPPETGKPKAMSRWSKDPKAAGFAIAL